MKWVKRIFAGLLVLLLIGAYVFFAILPDRIGASLNTVRNTPPYDASTEAQELHKTLFIADMHGDALLWSRDLNLRSDWGHVDLPRLRDANVALQAFTVVTKSPAGQGIETNSADTRDNITPLVIAQRWPIASWFSLKERALYQAKRLHQLEARANDNFVIVKSAADLRRFLQDREENPTLVAGFLGIEGLHCLEGDLKNVDVMFEAGYRMMGPAHFFDNDIGGSAHGEAKGSLTDLGREVITRMEELNIVIDLAHASANVIDEVLEMATRPVLVSHTGVRGTCDNQRNMSDKHIQGVAATGGVIGIGIWETAVCGTDAAATAQAIRYVADLVGVEHVGLGTDSDGTILAPFDITGIVQITEALMDEGFNNEEINAIMGTNVLRVLAETFPPE